MAVDSEALSELLGLLYEGLADPSRWRDFLSAVSRAIGCDKAAIVFHDRRNQKPAMGFFVGLPDDAMRDYNSYYGSKNPAALPILQSALKNGSWHGLVRSVVDDRSYKKSEYYAGWGRPHGVHHAVVGVASNDGNTSTSLSIMRAESAGPLGREAVTLMRLLVPHLKRAFQVQQKMEALRATAAAANSALERLDTGLIAVDGDGRVVLMNARAAAIVEEQNGIALRDGRLTATDESQASQLENLVQSAAATGAGRGTKQGGAILVQGSEPGLSLPLTVVPFNSSHLLAEQGPSALVFVSDPVAKPASRAALLATLFGLTPAECRLADFLAEEMDLRAAAERMRITVGSARFMLKSIFRKTAIHRQSQLIRLLMCLPGAHP